MIIIAPPTPWTRGAISGQSFMLVADVETYGTDPNNGKLLGVALCPIDDPNKAEYIALQWYDYKTSTWYKHDNYDHITWQISHDLTNNELIGHNYAYDKAWLDHCLGLDTKWHACTRLMWHIASAPSGPRPYGLKDAQVEVLGWEKRGDDRLREQVEARGGRIKEGDHYLADKEVLRHYACLDASSTAMLYNHLKPFYDKHEYWWMLEAMVKYSWLLHECTVSGIQVDVSALEKQIEILSDTKGAYEAAFMELAAPHIARLERIWRDHRATKYTIPTAKERFLSSWEMQKKFKPSSDKDKRELFYEELKLPIVVETEGGKGSTGVDAIKIAVREGKREDLSELVEAYEQFETSETLLNSFAKPWLGALIGTRLHPRFNPCGTVSYRLSGFKPYLLNAPFDEKELMSCLKCDEGWVGVHADFASIEPCVTAHYSQDPSLLKVFREGLGDVYLDLALTLFLNDKELKEGYNPNAPITSEVKERFKEQRKIAKGIQLAVQYTGTEYTVHKNLSYSGMPISLQEAKTLVGAYWNHFRKVKVMNEALFIHFERQGYLRNVVGRIIRVPTSIPIRKRDGTIWEKPIPRYKDLPNRFIQSSAHDLLSFYAMEIDRMVKWLGMKARPILLDCHDSTSWTCPKEEVEELERVFKDALTNLNSQVKMTVPVKIEIKRFETLAGLKGKE